MISIRLKKLYRVCLKKTNKMDGFVSGFYYFAFCAFWSGSGILMGQVD
jgi:hypothetical protein